MSVQKNTMKKQQNLIPRAKSTNGKVILKKQSKSLEKKSKNNTQLNTNIVGQATEYARTFLERTITKEEIAENEKRKGYFREGFSQDIIPIKKFIGGMILTTDNRVVKILEVIPVNYYQKSNKERNRIIESYKAFFRISPAIVQVKAVTESTNMICLLDNLKIQYSKETNEKLKSCIKRFMIYIENLAKQKSHTKKFYVIYQYEGNSSDLNEIYEDMMSTANYIAIRFSEIGNLVLRHENDNTFNIDVLYRFFNRKSMYKETVNLRYVRINADAKQYNDGIPENIQKGIDEKSYIAPRGYDNSYIDAVLLDGTYFTFLALTSDGYPEDVYGAWIDNLSYGNGIDIDLYFRKTSRESSISRLKTTARFTRVSASRQETRNPEKYKEMMSGLQNRNYILNSLESGDDMFYTNIIITIRGDSLDAVRQKRKTILKDLESHNVFLEECYKDAETYFFSTMPLCNLDKSIYRRTRQNMTTSSCAFTYNYTSYELFDETRASIVIGKNLENGSIVALNNYNTERYTNANILMIGTSGAGKTFTEQCMGTRQSMIGIRTFYLLPVKAHEYYKGIMQMGGSYIKLHPGCESCINIMEIHPEEAIDRNLVEDISDVKPSLLSKKVNTLSVFITLLLKDGEDISTVELNYLNSIIVELYHDYGITDDNNSIYINKRTKQIKKMPHIEDLYERMSKCPQLRRLTPLLLPFITGIFKNFNGDTNVDLSQRTIAFDVDKDIVGKQMLAAIMYIAFDLMYDMVKSSRLYFDSIYLDEVWIMMRNRACAEQVQNLLKIIRGYGGAAIVSTQDIFDFLNNEFGPAIIGNTDIKILLKLKDKEAERVSNYIDLSEDELIRIQQFNRGDCLLITNRDRIKLHIEASEFEVETFTTDPNLLRKFAEKRRLSELDNQK